MTAIDTTQRTIQAPAAGTVDYKLEVLTIPVSDVDRAKAFYASLGWREDADFPIRDDFRVIQMTPPGSPASIIFGSGVTAAAARLLRGPGPRRLRHRGRPRRPDRPRRRGLRVLPLEPFDRYGERVERPRPGAQLLHLLRLLPGPRRQHLDPAGDPAAAPGALEP